MSKVLKATLNFWRFMHRVKSDLSLQPLPSTNAGVGSTCKAVPSKERSSARPRPTALPSVARTSLGQNLLASRFSAGHHTHCYCSQTWN